MNTSDIKLQIFREIDSLEKNKLQEIYGLIKNYINSKKELSDWDVLSDVQKQGIIEAIEQVKNGKIKKHQDVINDLKKKYADA